MWYMILVLAIWSGSCAAMDHQKVVTVSRDESKTDNEAARDAAMTYYAHRNHRKGISKEEITFHEECINYLVHNSSDLEKILLIKNGFVMVHGFNNGLIWLPFLHADKEERRLIPGPGTTEFVACSIIGSIDHSVVCAVDNNNIVDKWTVFDALRKHRESYTKYAQRIPGAIKAIRNLHEHAAVVFTEQGASLAVDSGNEHTILPIPNSREMTRIKANTKYGLYKCINADKSSTIYRVEDNILQLVENAQALESKFKSECVIQ